MLKPPQADTRVIAKVSVVDIDMPFGSMVGFMIKWAIAAIPALLILFGLTAFAAGVLAALGLAFS